MFVLWRDIIIYNILYLNRKNKIAAKKAKKVGGQKGSICILVLNWLT